ncbi:MAG: SBBP repeat-containing protein [Bacteroidia bacterium]|nr:SBBP repeat-containing protein [Bacteroidia bacterium]
MAILMACSLTLPAQWTIQLKDAPAQGEFVKLAYGADGYIYMLGYFSGTLRTPAGDLRSAGGEDVFLAAYDELGQLDWIRSFGGTGTDRAYGLYVDPVGNTYLTGETDGNFSYGGTYLFQSGLFVLSLSATGAPRWLRQFTFESGKRSIGQALAGDKLGQVTICGVVEAGGGRRYTGIARLNHMGELLWSTTATGSPAQVTFTDAVLDPRGHTTISGFAQESFSYFWDSVANAGDADIILAKYNAEGRFMRISEFGGPGHDQATGLGADSMSNLFVTGLFESTMQIGTATLRSSGGQDVFVAKFTAGGELRWVQTAGGKGNDTGVDVAADPDGNVFLLGRIQDSARVGSHLLVTASGQEHFLAKYDTAGQVLWAIKLGWLFDNAPAETPESITRWSDFIRLLTQRNFSALLGEFTATWNPANGDVDLHWRSELEVNTFEFVVERSSDAALWEPIGAVPAAGISVQPIPYEWSDAAPPSQLPKWYYRLRQVDLFGNLSYSTPIEFRKALDAGFVAFPSPTSGPIEVLLTGEVPPGALELSIMDASGRRLMRIAPFEANRRLPLDLSALSTGIYYLQVRELNSSYRAQFKLIKI